MNRVRAVKESTSHDGTVPVPFAARGPVRQRAVDAAGEFRRRVDSLVSLDEKSFEALDPTTFPPLLALIGDR